MMSMILGRAIWGVVVLRLGVCTQGEPLERYEYKQPHMGTEFTLVLYTSDEATARRASERAFARVEDLNGILSDYDPESELMRLCARAGGPAVEVSEDLFRVLERAQDLSARSGGAFDCTIGPVGRLWRRARRTRQVPDAADLAAALRHVGHQKIRLDATARTVELLEPGMKLDLGGIAKGYAADEAAKVLKAQGVAHALVAAAGDIVCLEPPPGQEYWTVDVAALGGGAGKHAAARLRLARRAVSTSGGAEQFVDIDGVRYSHIVDPRTGLGVTRRSSATVIADDGTTADSLATALSVMGAERGMPLVEATPGAAALYVEAGEAGDRVVKSTGWNRFVGR